MKKINIVDINDPKNHEFKKWEDEIIIFSDEWENRKNQCENFLNSLNHIYEKKIHGRDCIVKEITQEKSGEFLDEYHIQGKNRLVIISFGLFYKEELIAVMSLGRHNRQISENKIVLDRFCVKNKIHVNGGASKLFKRCVEWANNKKYDEIISFSNNRWTNGNVYKVLGFSIEKKYSSDYSYVDLQGKRLSKQSQKKSNTKCPKNLTEFEWATQRGFKKIWDKGKIRWVYSLNTEKMSFKQKMSKKCAEQHQNGIFKHSHIRGYFKSKKNSDEIYYGSSYELRCLFLLEKNDNVKNICRCDCFLDNTGMYRNPDFKIEHLNNSIEIIEVKPESRLSELEVQKQIKESKEYCEKNNYIFSIWTEKESGLSDEKQIISWARKYIAETTGNTEWINKQKEVSKKSSKKHYENKIKKNKIQIYCDFCKITHDVLRYSYNKNIERNKRYICEKEGGHIAGKKPKKKKENPYKDQGMKQCMICKNIKLFNEFGFDKNKSDGYATRCKKCRSDLSKINYQKNK